MKRYWHEDHQMILYSGQFIFFDNSLANLRDMTGLTVLKQYHVAF
jgi:hypothetical protein